MCSEKIKCVVYRDKEYPSSWIDEKAGSPGKIAEFLEKRGLRIVNAEELRKFMIEGIENDDAYQRFVVFAQDVIPETIAEDYYPNTTIREFLDYGGSILWIGDIPGFYIGVNKEHTKIKEDISKYGSPIYMFGVVPLFAESVKAPVKITKQGRKLGLRHKWSGRRPIFYDKSITKLAVSESIFSRPYSIGVPKPPSGIKRIISKTLDTLCIKSVEIPRVFSIKFKEPMKESEERVTYFHEVFVNAWFKNYNESYPFSGLYRIWDFGPRNLPNWMLNELWEVIQRIKERLEKQCKMIEKVNRLCEIFIKIS